jgi:hypothetical protein
MARESPKRFVVHVYYEGADGSEQKMESKLVSWAKAHSISAEHERMGRTTYIEERIKKKPSKWVPDWKRKTYK